MLEGMEELECCANCKHFITEELRCQLQVDINKELIYFYWCGDFKVDKIDSHEDCKDKLIYNMARYIAKQDIDYDICTPMVKEGGCLIEKTHADGLDCGLDMCIECVKNWFSEDREEDK